MEDKNEEANSMKRNRGDFDLESPVSELANVPEAKRLRMESSFGVCGNSPEVDRLAIHILDILDEPESVADRNAAIPNLDAVIRSFEEEIHRSAAEQPPEEQATTSPVSGGGRPELGYLREASDVELGLPPAISPSEDSIEEDEASHYTTVAPEPVGFSMEAFEDVFPSYGPFEFGIGEEAEFVTVGGGLFDGEEAFEFSEFLWRPESDLVHAWWP